MNEKIRQYREEITARLADALEKGKAPWQKPWNGEGMPHNAVTGRKYSGSNAVVLALIGLELDDGKDPRWMTFNQARAKGWSVRKGEHGTRISFWKNFETPIEGADGEPLLDKDGKPLTKNILMEKLFTIFHASQIEGIPAYSPAPINAVEANGKAERIIADSGADIRHEGFRAFYSPGEDCVRLPGPEFFMDTASYYATALHELTHWTGHGSRLGRNLDGEKGSPSYAREELAAEIGSMFVSAETGIPQTEEHFKNHAAYVGGWISLLKSDPDALFKAASDANKAAEFLLKKERERAQEQDGEEQAA